MTGLALAHGESLQTTRLRLARYYLHRLEAANIAYQKGYENTADALAAFDQDWPQIRQWQAWSASFAQTDPDAATLCKEYAEVGFTILSLRQPISEQIDWLQAALRIAQVQQDRLAEMWCLYYLAEAHNWQGLFRQTADEARQALVLAREFNNKMCLGLTTWLVAETERRFGQYAAARDRFMESLTILRQYGTQQQVGRAYSGLGLVAWQQGDLKAASDYHLQHLSIAKTLALETEICDALINLSLPVWVMGDGVKARTYLEECISLCRAIGYYRVLATSLNTLGMLVHEAGSLEEALQRYDEALAISRANGITWNVPLYLHNKGEVLFNMGKYEEALVYLDEGLELARIQGSERSTAEGLVFLIMTHAALGNIDRASACAWEGLTIARRIGAPLLKIQMMMGVLSLWPGLGRTRQAAEWGGLLLSLDGMPRWEQAVIRHECDQFASSLGGQELEAAMEAGKALELDGVIQAALEVLDVILGSAHGA